MTGLDVDYVNRAAPPGSMRYFALLYTPSERRELLTALFVVESEIRASATQIAHEVAHTRMQWWRGEIDRLVNRNAQHPATRILQSSLPNSDFTLLHEFMASADMDLARMTYNNSNEFAAYLERSGSILQLLTADPATETRGAVRNLSALIRRTETLRDLVMEARNGRLYWPLDQLDANRVETQSLRSAEMVPALAAMIENESLQLATKMRSVVETIDAPVLRPVVVLTRLHERLLRRIERARGNVFTQRHELGPLEKVWTAWRAARLV